MSTLVRQEVALAKAELRQEAKTAGTAVGAFGGAGFAGYFVLVFLSLAMMWALGSTMALGWAALIVAGVWAVVAGGARGASAAASSRRSAPGPSARSRR